MNKNLLLLLICVYNPLVTYLSIITYILKVESSVFPPYTFNNSLLPFPWETVLLVAPLVVPKQSAVSSFQHREQLLMHKAMRAVIQAILWSFSCHRQCHMFQWPRLTPAQCCTRRSECAAWLPLKYTEHNCRCLISQHNIHYHHQRHHLMCLTERIQCTLIISLKIFAIQWSCNSTPIGSSAS